MLYIGYTIEEYRGNRSRDYRQIKPQGYKLYLRETSRHESTGQLHFQLLRRNKLFASYEEAQTYALKYFLHLKLAVAWTYLGELHSNQMLLDPRQPMFIAKRLPGAPIMYKLRVPRKHKPLKDSI